MSDASHSSDLVQIYSRNGAPVDERNRLRGSYRDEDGVRHAVNGMVIYLNGERTSPICDSWETECLDHWWQERQPPMSAGRVTCINCLAGSPR